ncbi:regulating synaptic membrane exocytosis protein 3-like, partial [Rhagoletis pomonella]|uniref:regulating synaptic membrane exocytosis protein 3-like n=1 Tax=Rhagoletis pomonella TaxID=28610 RepID=UPI00177AF7B6
MLSTSLVCAINVSIFSFILQPLEQLRLGGSRICLPSNPSSRKGSILDISQQQQQQQQQQQHQQHQQLQQHLQQQLPVGIGNAATSPPSDEENNKQFSPRWKGSGNNLRPQSAKQALSMLKQASSATNVAMQGGQSASGSLLSVGADSPKQLRKGSMINLKTGAGDNALAPSPMLQRKGSVYAHTNTERETGSMGSMVSGSSGSLQRKGSVYPGGRAAGALEAEASPMRKPSMYNVNTTDSPSMLRKQSMAPHNASAKNLSHHGSHAGSIGSLTSTTVTTVATTGIDTDYGLKMGPGQIHPKGYRLTTVRHGELKMGFAKIKGVVEVEVICARNIVPVDCETPPDTYVKCYVKDGDRLRHKKKTRVVRHSAEPIYKQTLKYQ